MLNAAYETMAMVPLAFLSLRVRDGVAMTPTPSRAIDEPLRREANGRLATIIDSIRARRAQKRRELMEFRAWLKITAEPFG
ncbi:hypothetical protein [Mycobacterium sp.]|uniref:hypothetical protein n=1 Tax=Mycobacterium sp. TaxID=1785 RepID=UPI0025E9EF6C|nr:hypothetical protein [Mycobacterium sp.]